MKEESLEHEGHSIELVRAEGGEQVLLVDGVRVRYGQDDGGLYYLQPYAYDRHESLLEVARRYVEYRERAASVKAEREGA